jgi:outer membrane biosynthesis protein TonB
MGRAPNSGVPQRVSMHVVPKAKPFSDDEEDRTTIESQWEEEPSTTVEQGEVADKIRSLGVDPSPARRSITGVTNTSSNSLGNEEPTVDDGSVNPDVPPIPRAGAARMVITQGTDAGKDFDIDGDKIYSIGRALENDIVLTDIAVSRKHFDLRFDAGAWVIVDHGSGNGTVVNGNLEDNPFMLANGDVIEIGTTSFRFEQQAQELARASNPTFDVDVDDHDHDEDEELSTVAGKPIHQKLDTPQEVSTYAPTYVPLSRPKTLPPPTPLRPRGSTQPPPAFSLPPPPIQPSQAPPSTTLPMPQMANRPPISPPNSPTLLGGLPPMQLPTTIPGQGPTSASLAQTLSPAQPLFYPQALEIPPHSVHAQLMVQAQNRRGDHSTAHVQPVAYGNGMLAQPRPRLLSAQLSRRTKLGVGLGALSVLAAITTIALLRTSKSAKAASTGTGSGSAVIAKAPPKPAPIPIQIAKQPDPPKPVVVPVKPPDPKPVTPPVIAKDPPKPDPKPEPRVDPKPVQPVIARRPDPTPRTEPKPDPKPEKPEPKLAQSKRVASADDARAKADELYQDKRFSDASSTLLAAARSSDGDTARDLRLKAQRYAALGKAFNQGMAPGADPGEAFDALRAASSYDQNVGGHFSSDISAKLAQIAPRAAISFVATGELEKAHVAVIEAEQLGGSSNSNVKAVRAKLEREAGDIYAQAVSAGVDSADGKDKLKRIKSIVDSKSPWYQKATAALKGA